MKVTKNNFEEEVLKSEKTVLVDLYADWCGPCRMLAPILEEVETEREDVKVCKINVDEEAEIALLQAPDIKPRSRCLPLSPGSEKAARDCRK